MWISHTRASFVAVLMAGGSITLVALVRGRLRWRTLGLAALVAGVGVAAFWSGSARSSRRTSVPVTSGRRSTRGCELNEIALVMIDDHPVLGIGLNNFEIVLPTLRGEPGDLLRQPGAQPLPALPGRDRHHRLPRCADPGRCPLRQAIRLGRSSDRLLAGVGIGVAGAMGFVMVEELLGFSLRHDIRAASSGCSPAWPWPACLPHSSTAGRGLRPRRQSPPARSAAFRTRSARRARPVGAVLVLALVGPMALTAPRTCVADRGCSGRLTPAHLPRHRAGHRRIWHLHRPGRRDRHPSSARTTGRDYIWRRWAFGNTKMIYTVIPAHEKTDNIELMDPDGKDQPSSCTNSPTLSRSRSSIRPDATCTTPE